MPTRPCKGACGRTATRHSKTGYCKTCFTSHREGDTAQVPGTSLVASGASASLTTVTAEKVRTLADLVRVCEIDTDAWTVERWVVNKWEMGAVIDDTPVTTPLFQVKAWLVKNTTVLDAKVRIADLVADAQKRIPKPPKSTFALRGLKGGHLLELAIPDLHLGKLAWSPETGYADYDLKIAEALYRQAVDTLLTRTIGYDLTQIVLPIGNDFFHSDTKQGQTTKGTPLDTDSRYHKAFLTGRRMIVDVVTRLALTAPVTVVVVPGNHDTLSAFHLGDALECWFHTNKAVTVMNAPMPRKYVAFGKTALMFTHGDKGKAADLPLLFATEQPEMFANATFREIHSGHLHTTRLTEKMGVRVRISPALCSPDEWHASNHFVGNLRGAEALVYHREEGLVNTAHFTVQETPQS